MLPTQPLCRAAFTRALFGFPLFHGEVFTRSAFLPCSEPRQDHSLKMPCQRRWRPHYIACAGCLKSILSYSFIPLETVSLVVVLPHRFQIGIRGPPPPLLRRSARNRQQGDICLAQLAGVLHSEKGVTIQHSDLAALGRLAALLSHQDLPTLPGLCFRSDLGFAVDPWMEVGSTWMEVVIYICLQAASSLQLGRRSAVFFGVV